MLAWRVARQHGVVARWQLIRDGVTSAQIQRWLERGRLLRVYRGVYAAGHPELRPEGHRVAAVLACGPGAVLSHRSAASAWGLRPSARSRADVTIIRAGGRKLPGIDAHRAALEPRDRTTLDGVPITTVARTALDLAEVVSAQQLGRYLVAAEQRRCFDLDAFVDVLQRGHGRQGLGALARALEAHRPERAANRSDMELLALELIDAHGLPRPSVNREIGPYEVDLQWPARRVVVELDSRAFHLTTDAFEHDRRRDADLLAAGWVTLRFTWRHLTDDADWVAGRLAQVLARPG